MSTFSPGQTFCRGFSNAAVAPDTRTARDPPASVQINNGGADSVQVLWHRKPRTVDFAIHEVGPEVARATPNHRTAD